MKSQDIRAIDNAANRGMNFHIFADTYVYDNYANDEWATKKIYQTSWNSLGTAQAVAKNYINPIIYNSSYEVVR